MANITVLTTPVRASWTHLVTPKAGQNPTDTPKYQLSVLFPKSGFLPDHIGAGIESNFNNVYAALDKACQEEWGIDFQAGDTLIMNAGLDYQAHIVAGHNDASLVSQGFATMGTGQGAAYARGVEHPPKLADGDQDFMKDPTTGNRGTIVNEKSVGQWKITFKNKDRVGCVDAGDHANGVKPVEIDPSAVYSGSWVRVKLQVSAYDRKGGGSVISITLLSVQMMYNDERWGGQAAPQSAVAAFSDMAVVGTNIAAGSLQTMSAVPAGVVAAPVAAPVAVAPVAGVVAAPVAVAPVAVAPVAVAPVTAPVAPVAVAAPVAGVVAAPVAVAAPAPVAVAPVAAPVAVATPLAAPVAVAPAPCPVIMNAGLDYQAHIVAGHNDASLVSQNLAVLNPDFLNPVVA